MQLAVFVVEDNPEFQETLTHALEELTSVQVIGGAASEEDALAWVAAHPLGWDLMIVDLFLRGGSGIRLLHRVRRARVEQKLVVFSNYVNAAVRKRCAQMGVDAVFDKSTEIDGLIDYCASQRVLPGPSATPASPRQPSGELP